MKGNFNTAALKEIESSELAQKIKDGARKALADGSKRFCVKTDNNMRHCKSELTALCKRMQHSFAEVAEIDANRRDNELVVFMHKKPNFITRWIMTSPTSDGPDVHDLVGFG